MQQYYIEGKRVCRKCELEKETALLTESLIMEKVAGMESVEGVTVSQEEFERRLSVCEDCPSLLSGIQCAHSGYYVAFKAKQIASACPFPEGDRWRFAK